MKKITLLLALSILIIPPTLAQDRISESDILGTWKMIIDMEEVLEEIEEEADESETLLAQVLLESVSGIIEGVMDRIDIYIEFERGGDASIRVNAFDATSDDDDDTEWYIKNGRLYIEETDNFNSDNDGYWVMRDDVLYFEDYDGDNDVTIYMVRMED